MQRLLQTEWEKMNEIVYQMNEAEDMKLVRKKFLQQINQLISYDLADFCLSNYTESQGVQLIDPVVHSRYPKKFEELFTTKYEKQFQQLDYTKWTYSNSESIVYIESEIINNEARMKSSYYVDYLKPMNLTNVMAMSLTNKGIPLAVVSFYRSSEKGDFTKKELYILQQFVPHLKIKLLSDYKVNLREAKQENVSSLLMNQYKLSKREVEIIKLVCQGLNNQKIGEKLYISTNTVKKHMSHILSKLDVSNRVELINYFIRNDWDLFK